MDIMKVKDSQGNWITVPAFQGQMGKTPSFSIGRVDVGATPSSADATITGTDEAPVLNLVLPKGVDGENGDDGISPSVTITNITNGHRIAITDADGTQTFDVMDGAVGPAGPGVATSGNTGQILAKSSSTDYDTQWINPFVIHTANLNIPYANWTGSDPYSQVITIANATITTKTKVDIQPDATAFAQLVNDGVAAMYIENNSGTLTIYAIGAAPTANLSIQVSYYETT